MEKSNNDDHEVYCPYCSNKAEIKTGKDIYPHRPDLAHRVFFACMPCGAWVGTHESSQKPFGRLANKELRKLKSQAHNAFDALWRDYKIMSRRRAYKWLAGRMQIKPKWCHIGQFNEEQCRKVIQVSMEKRKSLNPINKIIKK